MSIERLLSGIREKGNPSCLGLDPKLEFIPPFIIEKNIREYGRTLEAAAESILEFNFALIDGLCGIVPAVKPQSAYYEMCGAPGVAALQKTMRFAGEKGLYVIADAKRNDIGPTAEAYAEAYLGEVRIAGAAFCPFPADGLTVNPYLGSDGIMPFVGKCAAGGKSIFILVKTSNPSSGELQDRDMDGLPLYMRVAELISDWGKSAMTPSGYSGVGAVVGATYPEQQKQIRKVLKDAVFLVPGYGAQGAGAEGIVNCFNEDGTGAVVNSSRAIICAWQKTKNGGRDYVDAARSEALRMKDDIARALRGGK